MARIQILNLPGDGHPFAIVIDQVNDTGAVVETIKASDAAGRLGARSILAFEETIEIVGQSSTPIGDLASRPDLDLTDVSADANPFTFVFEQTNGYGDSKWGWRCEGIRHCTGNVDLDYANGDEAAAGYAEHARHLHGALPTVDQLHERRACPGWEYATTEGPRKKWDYADQPPYDDKGEPDPTWERNTAAGRDGWERFDYTEESYWRRRKQAASVNSPSSP